VRSETYTQTPIHHPFLKPPLNPSIEEGERRNRAKKKGGRNLSGYGDSQKARNICSWNVNGWESSGKRVGNFLGSAPQGLEKTASSCSILEKRTKAETQKNSLAQQIRNIVLEVATLNIGHFITRRDYPKRMKRFVDAGQRSLCLSRNRGILRTTPHGIPVDYPRAYSGNDKLVTVTDAGSCL